MSVTFSYLVEEKHPSGLELLVFFNFINFFLKTLTKNIIYCQTVHVFGQFTHALICKNICQTSLPLFLLPVIFSLDPCQTEITCSTKHLCSTKHRSLAHKLRVMAAVKQHLNATYAQHLALKSVYEKRQ